MKSIKLFVLSLSVLLISALSLSAHCQVPCGIYADDVVIGELDTDVATIIKAMQQINELKVDVSSNPHQLVRWINNKESHAQNIQDVMSAYFLAQRIKVDLSKSDPEKYIKLLELAHKITVYAMKCKQTSDMENADLLHVAFHEFEALYLGK